LQLVIKSSMRTGRTGGLVLRDEGWMDERVRPDWQHGVKKTSCKRYLDFADKGKVLSARAGLG
jgi:hypothetical protein